MDTTKLTQFSHQFSKSEERITAKELAKYLSVSVSYLEKNRMKPEGERIPFDKIGRSIRYRKSVVDAFFESKAIAADAQGGGNA